MTLCSQQLEKTDPGTKWWMWESRPHQYSPDPFVDWYLLSHHAGIYQVSREVTLTRGHSKCSTEFKAMTITRSLESPHTSKPVCKRKEISMGQALPMNNKRYQEINSRFVSHPEGLTQGTVVLYGLSRDISCDEESSYIFSWCRGQFGNRHPCSHFASFPSLLHFSPTLSLPWDSAPNKALACKETRLGETSTWVLICQEAVGRNWIPSQG